MRVCVCLCVVLLTSNWLNSNNGYNPSLYLWQHVCEALRLNLSKIQFHPVCSGGLWLLQRHTGTERGRETDVRKREGLLHVDYGLVWHWFISGEIWKQRSYTVADQVSHTSNLCSVTNKSRCGSFGVGKGSDDELNEPTTRCTLHSTKPLKSTVSLGRSSYVHIIYIINSRWSFCRSESEVH